MKAKRGDRGFNAIPLNLKRGLVTAILVVSVLAMFIAVASAADYYVRTGGLDEESRDGLTNNDANAWQTISYAIGRAEVTAGDTIHVAAGDYTENVNVNKAHLTLQGEGADVVTVTAASANDHVFEVKSDYVNISGFTATGATGGKAGIYLGRNIDHCNISDNNASNNRYGIYLFYSCNYNNLSGNNAYDNSHYGIYLSYLSNYNELTNNTAKSNTQYGIYLNNADNNNITCNWVAHNEYRGFNLDVGSTGNNISYNNIMSNGNYNSGTGGWEWNFYNEQSDAVVAENNYWGTTTSAVIAAGIKQNTGSVDYDPFLTEPAPCAPGPEPAPAPPNITSFAPPSPVNDTVCNWRTVNVTVNQTVNVSWYLNNTLQHTNVSTKEANYTLHAEVVGEHNVSAIASNANGTDMQTWVWNVIAPGISVEKTANLTEGAPCTNVAFTINVTNTGDCTLNPVKVVDTLPTGMSYVSSSPAADTHDGTVTWNNVGPLAAFTGSKTLYLVAHIDSDATGILNNTVIAMGTPPEGDNVTDKGFAEVTTLNPAISVTKTASPSSGAASTNVNFTIVVSNTCDCALNPVKVVDTLPTGMSYVSSSPAADTHDGTITWDLGSMASGASTTIHLTAHIDEGASGTLTDSVTATGTPPHGDDVSATDTADVTVLAPGISVNKVANPPDVAPSSNV